MKKLKNYFELADQITEMCIQIDSEFRPYKTDIYVIYDEATKTGKPYECSFDATPNGDNLYYVGYRTESYDDATDLFDSIETLSQTVGISEEELIERAARFQRIDVDEVSDHDVKAYIKYNDDLYKKCLEEYVEWLREGSQDYNQVAREMLDEEFEPEE